MTVVESPPPKYAIEAYAAAFNRQSELGATRHFREAVGMLPWCNAVPLGVRGLFICPSLSTMVFCGVDTAMWAGRRRRKRGDAV